jgi:dTMP kinase
MSTFWLAALGIFGLGACAGAVYVLGFTILHETVVDELRGRIFSSLYTLVRVCLLLSFAVGPLLADRLGALSESLFDSEVHLGAVHVGIPGVRLALWISSLTIIGAGFVAVSAFRHARRHLT